MINRSWVVALLTGAIVAGGAYALHVWQLNRALNFAGVCIEKGRILSDRELIHGALKRAFDNKVELYTQTTVDYGDGAIIYDLTDADVELFVKSPISKTCCKIFAAIDRNVINADFYRLKPKFDFNLSNRSTGNMRAYILVESRHISQDKSISFPRGYYPVDNCGMPASNLSPETLDINVLDVEKSVPRLRKPSDYSSVEQVMKSHQPYIQARKNRKSEL
jgi:hypothetical protein